MSLRLFEVKVTDTKSLLDSEHSSVCFEVVNNETDQIILRAMCSAGFTYPWSDDISDMFKSYAYEVKKDELVILDMISSVDVDSFDESIPICMDRLFEGIFSYYYDRNKIVAFNQSLLGEEINKVFDWYYSRFIVDRCIDPLTTNNIHRPFIVQHQKVRLNGNKDYLVSRHDKTYIFNHHCRIRNDNDISDDFSINGL